MKTNNFSIVLLVCLTSVLLPTSEVFAVYCESSLSCEGTECFCNEVAPSPSPSPTATCTVTPSPSPTATCTVTPSPSPTATCTITPEVTLTPTATPSPSPSPTATLTPVPTTPAAVVTPNSVPEIATPQCSIALEKELRCEGSAGTSSFIFSGKLIGQNTIGDGSLSWSLKCVGTSGELFNVATGAKANSTSSINASAVSVVIAQPAQGQSGTCSLVGQVENSSGKKSECGYAVLVAPCDLQCTTLNVQANLFGLDGALRDQKAAVTMVARLLREALKKNKLGLAEEARASELYGVGWQEIWSLPPVVAQCANTVACSSASTQSYSSNFKARSSELYQIARTMLKRINRVRGLTAKQKRASKLLERRVAVAYQESVTEAATIPTTISTCSNTSGPSSSLA